MKTYNPDTYNVHSTSVVANHVKHDIVNVRDMTLSEFARSIGKTPQNIYNMLNGQRRLSRKTAELLNEKYKYSIAYLTQGIGQLYENPEDNPSYSWRVNTGGEVPNETDSFGGLFFPEGGNLSKRERLLNDYAIKFKHLFQETQLTIVGRKYSADLFFEADDLAKELGFKARSPKEWSIFKSILFDYSLMKFLLDPVAILKELDEVGESD